MTGMAGNGWKWLEITRMADNDWKLLEIAGMAGNSCKWLLVFALGPKYDLIGL